MEKIKCTGVKKAPYLLFLFSLCCVLTARGMSLEGWAIAPVEAESSPAVCAPLKCSGTPSSSKAAGSASKGLVIQKRDCSDIEPVMQNPGYPNGCEIASLATVLQYEGFPVTLEELDSQYLPKADFTYTKRGIRLGPNPGEVYVGEPSSSSGGWYCMERPIVEAANRYLAAQGSALKAEALAENTLADLEEYLSNGTPVIIWFTVDYSMPKLNSTFYWMLPSGQKYQPYSNLHCLVLIAADNKTCRLADPLIGVTEIDRELFETIYNAMGQRAIIITALK